MKRLHVLGFTCVCLGIAAMLLFRANTYAIAASQSSCGLWNVVPSPNNGNSSLSGIATIAANDMWAVGYSYPNNKIYNKTLIEHWDGTSWNIVPSPNVPSANNYLNGVTAVSTNDIWAVGYIQTKYGRGEALTEHWDGTKWSIVPGAPTHESSSLSAVGVISATDIWAVGNYSAGTLTEHWNGTAWSIVPSPNPGDYTNGFNAVANIPGSNYVWAVGEADYSTTQYQYGFRSTLTAYYC